MGGETRRNWWAFFVLGTVNNLAYVVVLSAAQSLVNDFGTQKLFGLVSWADVFIGFGARSINTWFLEGTPYSYRVIGNAIVYSVGVVGVSCSLFASHYAGFSIALVSIVFVGAASSFGESVMLGYLRLFEGDLVSGWSSGTGLAGVLGSVLYLVLDIAFNKNNQYIFATLTIFIPIYLGAFFVVLRRPAEVQQIRKKSAPNKAAENPNKPILAFGLLDSDGQVEEADPTDVQAGETGWQRTQRCLWLVFPLALQLMLVYTLEYLASGAAADAANFNCGRFGNLKDCVNHSSCRWFPANRGDKCQAAHSDNITKRAESNAYVLLTICYQVGVLISRSSLNLVKIKRVEMLTILQAINLVFWLLQDKLRFLNIWVQFVCMVYVGLLGGAAYVNVFYILLNTPKIPDQDREVSINITALFINAGIVVASIGALILDATLLKSIV